MLEQTKDAIDKLKRAGFKRSEFSVKSAGYDSRWGVTTAGLPRITMYAPLGRLYELLPAITSQRLTVRLWYGASYEIIGYEIKWAHYGHDPHLMIEPYSNYLDFDGDCMYCRKPATVLVDIERLRYCDGCFGRHENPGTYDYIERV